ncbi:hypothetical protein K439DRAFT_1630808 [Ramaria rubella]|nr:hypothetical protein K439DRAFT_1630808 [Ramaria rubella]
MERNAKIRSSNLLVALNFVRLRLALSCHDITTRILFANPSSLAVDPSYCANFTFLRRFLSLLMAEVPSDKSDPKQCRICLSGPEDEGICGRLIKPCLCKGSMQFVHVKCLNQWRMTSGSKSAFYSCDTCHYKYAFARTTVVGLATSPVVLGAASIFLFTLIVFLASVLIIFFFPTLATPSYTLEPHSIQNFLMTPVSLANRIIAVSAHTYESYFYRWWWWGGTDDWEPPEVIQPILDTRDPTQIGIFALLLHRFVLGLSAVGSLSFVTWIWQMSVLGPLRFRAFRNRSRNNGRDNVRVLTLTIVSVTHCATQDYS